MTRKWQRGRQPADALHLTCDRKVSPHGWHQESRDRWVALVPNSFGLPAGDTCPGRTPFCDSCYAADNERMMGVGEAVAHNYELLQRAGTVEAMFDLIEEAVGCYHGEAERLKLPAPDRIFRIHWDGDFFSVDYARAWAQAILRFPDVRFWAYTRSFTDPVNVVPVLAGLPNLALYLSVDEHNAADAAPVLAAHPAVRVAACADDYRTGREVAGPLASGRKAVVCPENAERLPLMEKGRGACVVCQLCPQGRRDIIFSTTHQEESLEVQLRRRRGGPTVDLTKTGDPGSPTAIPEPGTGTGPARMNGHDLLALLKTLPDEDLDLDVRTLVDLYDHPICSDCRTTHTSVWEALVCDERTAARARRLAARAARGAARAESIEREEERRRFLAAMR